MAGCSGYLRHHGPTDDERVTGRLKDDRHRRDHSFHGADESHDDDGADDLSAMGVVSSLGVCSAWTLHA